MAKNNKTETVSNTNIFRYAGFLLAIVVLISFVLVTIYHSRSNKIYTDATNATYYLRQINEELQMVNRNVLMIISDAGDSENLAQSIDNSFQNIEYYKEQYANTDGRSERELYRYNQAATFIGAYKKKFDACRSNLNALDTNLYIQEIHPLQTTASEMFNATIDINSENSQAQLGKVSLLFHTMQALMIALLLFGEGAIIFAAKMLERQNAIIRKREEELKKFQAKISVSTRDTNSIAKTNSITGLRNRYALSDDIKTRNKGGKVNIAIFDIDNFRYINDTYGYEYGDEFLHLLAKTLQKEFEDHADIYSYTNNGFAMLFDSSINEISAFSTSEKALTAFSRSYKVGTILVQLTASACFASYNSGEIRDFNKELIQMQTVVRKVKEDGGNKIEKLAQ